MTDTLTIDVVQPDAPEVGTALTVRDRAAVALSSAKTRTDLAELATKAAVIREIKNPAGRDECHSVLMSLIRARTTIEKAGKAAREDATAFQKAVIAEENSLYQVTAAEEARLKKLRDEWDLAEQRRKDEEARIEQARRAALQQRVDEIRDLPLAWVGRPSADMCVAIAKLKELVIDESFAEYQQAAQEARDIVLTRMEGLLATTRQAEQREREAAAERAERNRVDAIKARMSATQGLLATASMARTAALIRPLLERARAVSIDDSYAELAQQASDEKAATIDAIQALLDAKLAAEERAAGELAGQQLRGTSTVVSFPKRDEEAKNQQAASLLKAVANAPTPPAQPTFAPTNPGGLYAPLRPHRPSDELIVQCVADAWRVDYDTAFEWISSMDFSPQVA